MRTEIIHHYIKLVNTEEKEPHSVFRFCEQLQISEADFYQEFSDLDAVKEAVLAEMWETTLSALQDQPFYQEASGTDKLLSALYAFMEQLKQQRSYLLLTYKNWQKPTDSIKGLKVFRESFLHYLDTLDLAPLQTGIAPLDKASSHVNHHTLFANVLFVFHFWLNDKSKGFEKTDACIEKVFTLSFELMGNQTIKKAIDLGKFLFANK
jgi:AcrR family transcriptional regulator